jgi:hypothetical protein
MVHRVLKGHKVILVYKVLTEYKEVKDCLASKALMGYREVKVQMV